MTNAITNFQIEKTLKNINDEDIDDNFVVAFHSNHMNKFIDHTSMISHKKENIHLWLWTLITLARTGLIGGVYLTLRQKQIFPFSIHLVVMVEKYLLSRMTKKLLKKFILGLIK